MANLPISPVVVTATPGDPATNNSGLEGGSCASVIGVSTDVRWDTLAAAGRSAIDGTYDHQYIGWGGDNAVTGQEAADIPNFKLVEYGTSDFNDTPVGFVLTTAAVAPGGNMFSVYKNVSTTTCAIGEYAWGAVAVA